MKLTLKIAFIIAIGLYSNDAFSQPADWTVSPSDYSSNGQVTAIVIHGASEVTSGTLAAFVGGACRGVVDGVYFSLIMKTVFTVICYSNVNSGETLTFKYFDPSTGTVYEINETLPYTTDMIVGSASTPLSFHTLPLIYNVTGGTGSYCQGGSGLPVGLDNSEPGVTYTLYKNGNPQVPTVAGTGSAITFGNQLAGTYTVSGNNSGGTTNMAGSATFTENPLPVAAGTITGTSSVCRGRTAVAYTVPPITNATSYVWSYTGTGATINGTGNSVTLDFNSSATSGNLTVYGVNTCGNGVVSAVFPVTVNPYPDAAGTITGTSAVCQGATAVAYNVTQITNAISYAWTYSGTGASISGSTNAITITFSSTATSGNLTVYGVNSCGNGVVSAAYPVTVSPLPVAAGTITGTATVCQGAASVSYSVPTITNALSYNWAYSGTGASISGTTNAVTITFASNATSGNLTVRGVNTCGNGAFSANYPVVVNPLPAVAAIGGGAASVCVNSVTPAFTDVTAGGTWSVTPVTGTASITSGGIVTGLTAGTVTVTYTITNSCGSISATKSLTVNSLPATPTITAGGPLTFCSGSNVLLTSSPGTSYLWSTGATTSSISVATSGNYSVQVTDGNGCLSASSLTTAVTVNALPATPTISAGGPLIFCAGGSVTLTSSTGTSYLWSTGATTSSITVTTGGSYSVTVTNAAGCKSATSAATLVTVNALPATPTISAGGSLSFCSGGSVTLTSSAGSAYLWSNGATTQSINVTSGGSYTVKVTDGNGCQSASSAATVVTVNATPATPTISAGGPLTFCTGSNVTLTSSTGSAYLWSNGATTSSINVTTGGSYTVQVTDANSCKSAVSVPAVVTVNTLPVVNAGADVTIPNGTSTTLNATVSGTGPFTYSWTPSAQLVNATIEDPTTINLSSTTVFTLLATSTATSCFNTDNVIVTVSGSALSSVPTAAPSTICAGTSVQLNAVASGGSGTYTYTWSSSPAGFSSAVANPVVNPSVTTVYYVAVNDGFSIVNSQVTVTVNALPATPVITSGGPTTFCTGGSVTLTSSTGTTYLWSTGATTPSITVTTGGSYSVTVTNAAGCSSASSAATVVTVNSLPATPTISAGGPLTFCTGGSVTLTSSPGTTYSWSNGATTQSINATTGGSYTVQVTDATSCLSAPSIATVVTVNTLPAVPTITAGGPLTFCSGGGVTLTSSTGTTYLWSNGATSQSINVTSTGSYSVMVTNASGCQSLSSAATAVTVNPLPTITVTTAPSCAVDLLTYSFEVTVSQGTVTSSFGTATNTSSNIWLISGVPAATNVSVKVTDINSCENTTAVTAPNCACPIIQAPVSGGDKSYCASGVIPAITATVSTGETVDWYNSSSGGTLLMGSSLTYTPSAAGTYYAQARNIITNCISSTRTPVVVTMLALPAATLTSSDADNQFCAGTSVTFTAGGGTNYNFRVAGASIQNGTSSTFTTSALGNAQVVDVIVTNASGCSVTSAGIINTVSALPIPTLSSTDVDNTFCAGTVVTFTAGGGTSYNFRVGGTSMQTGALSTYTTNSLTDGQVVDVLVTNINGCSAISAGITNTVYLSPTPTLTSSDADNTFCAGTSVTFTSGGGTNYNFRVAGVSIQNGASPTFTTSTLTNGQVVDVIVTNASGCAATSAGITNIVNPPPVATLTSSDADNLFCSGTSVTFTAGGGTNYNFRVAGVSIQNSVSPTFTTSTLTNGQNVDVIVTNSNGCTATSAPIVNTVSTIPVPTLLSSDADNTFCAGTSVTFTAGGGTNYTFRVGGVSLQTGTSATYTINNLTNGQVVDAVVTNAAGCSATSAGITNIVNALPFIVITTSPTCSVDLLTYSLVVTVSSGTVTSTSGTVTNSSGNTWSVNGIPAGQNITITVTNSSGCINTLEVTAPNCACPVVPAPVSGGDKFYCASGTIPAISATVLSGETIDWYSVSTGGTPLLSGSLTYTPASAGTYYAQAMDIVTRCISSTRTPVTVTMNPLPLPVLTSSDVDNIFCSGTSVTFTAGGGTMYNFRVGGVSVQNGTSATYTSSTLTNGQVVDVIVTNASGCAATSTPISNTVNSTPVPTLVSSDADNIFCSGASVTFTAGGGTVFDFMIDGISVQNGASSTYTSSSLTNGQAVSVKVSNAGGCTATSSGITNTVNQAPIPTLTSSDSDNIICEGTKVIFTASGGTNYNFRVGAISVQNGISDTLTTTSLTNGQVVDVIVSNSSGCSVTSAGITNTVVSQPKANAGSGGNVCDLNFKLSAVPSTGIGTWMKTSGTGSATFAPNENSPDAVVTVTEYGTYNFTWTELSGQCSSISIISVNFYEQPVADAGTGGNNCGLGFLLNGTLNTGIGTWSKVSGPGSVTFTPDANNLNATATVTAFGTYKFRLTVLNGTCSATSDVTVVFIQQPPANAGSGGSECDNDFVLNALATGTGVGTWAKISGPGNAVFTPDNHQPDATVTVDQFGTYDFGWTVVNSTCTSSGVVRVVFHDLPVINAGADTAVCKGSTIQLLAEGVGAFNWVPADLLNNPAIFNPVASPETTTTFRVNLTDQFGCKNSDSLIVEVIEKAVADAGPDQVLDYVFETTMNAQLANDSETGIWSVISGTGQFADNKYSKTSVTDLSVAENLFLWTVSNGVCPSSSDSVKITVNDFIIPTLITPNMDGKNDYFVLRGLSTLGITELIIFDRRGAQMYKNSHYDNTWNGVDYNGNSLPDDTYFYVIRTENGKSLSGYIVIRH